MTKKDTMTSCSHCGINFKGDEFPEYLMKKGNFPREIAIQKATRYYGWTEQNKKMAGENTLTLKFVNFNLITTKCMFCGTSYSDQHKLLDHFAKPSDVHVPYIDRLTDILSSVARKCGKDEIEDFICPTGINHLIWMRKKIIEDSEFSETKKRRWLGYILGVLSFKNHIDIRYVQNPDHDRALTDSNTPFSEIAATYDNVILTNGIDELKDLHSDIKEGRFSELMSSQWVGFIQGYLTAGGYVDLNEEIETSRKYFKEKNL